MTGSGGPPHNGAGSAPPQTKAFVARLPGAGLDAQAVFGYSRDHLPNSKVPRAVEFFDVLPRNAAGKALKPQLREGA